MIAKSSSRLLLKGALLLMVFILALSGCRRGQRAQVSDEAVNEKPPVTTESPEPVVQPTEESHFTLGAADYDVNFDFQGRDRKYKVHVPASYDPDAPMPLVLALHGGSGNSEIMMKYYNWVRESDSAGFIVAFPDGVSRISSAQGDVGTWNAGECCAYAVQSRSDDVGYIRKVIEKISTDFNVDSHRVYATGFSNGGMMTYRLGCEATDLFAAIAPVSGTERIDNCNPRRVLPVFHIHARDDQTVVYTGGCNDEGCVAGESSTPVEETVLRWVERNKCNPTPTTVVKTPGVQCDVYSGCTDGVEVKLCTTETGGHSWPGSQKPRVTAATPTNAIDATAEIWKFFKQYSR